MNKLIAIVIPEGIGQAHVRRVDGDIASDRREIVHDGGLVPTGSAGLTRPPLKHPVSPAVAGLACGPPHRPSQLTHRPRLGELDRRSGRDMTGT